MSERIQMINAFYENSEEDTRLDRSRHGQLEYAVTMHYIHQYLHKDVKILEIGAGTGRYSLALAKEGYDVTAVELSEHNADILKEHSKDLKNIHCLQADALDLSMFLDDSFDLVLSLGPMYHLYDAKDVEQAIHEMIRVTKKDSIMLTAFLSVYAIMSDNYLKGNFSEGLLENFTEDYQVKHFEEQLFTGYDIQEFESLFLNKAVQYITTVGTDSILELAEERDDFNMSDTAFDQYLQYILNNCEKRELLGSNSHLLYICRKL